MGEYALMPYHEAKKNYGNFVKKRILGQCKIVGTYTATVKWGHEEGKRWEGVRFGGSLTKFFYVTVLYIYSYRHEYRNWIFLETRQYTFLKETASRY
jgi:hypothetical protein